MRHGRPGPGVDALCASPQSFSHKSLSDASVRAGHQNRLVVDSRSHFLFLRNFGWLVGWFEYVVVRYVVPNTAASDRTENVLILPIVQASAGYEAVEWQSHIQGHVERLFPF
jgi:hypothetical protein